MLVEKREKKESTWWSAWSRLRASGSSDHTSEGGEYHLHAMWAIQVTLTWAIHLVSLQRFWSVESPSEGGEHAKWGWSAWSRFRTPGALDPPSEGGEWAGLGDLLDRCLASHVDRGLIMLPFLLRLARWVSIPNILGNKRERVLTSWGLAYII